MKRTKTTQEIKKTTKIQKIILTFLLLIILQSCISGPYTNKGQQESWNKFIQSNSSDDWILVDLSEWYWDCLRNECTWDRKTDLYNYKTNTVSSSGLSVYLTKKKSYECKKEALVYVGKWQYAPRIGKEIRLFACQGERKGFSFRFEIKDEKNKLITEQPLKLNGPVESGGLSIERRWLALVKWFDKYGYNAYFDLKTGTIKQVGE